MMGNSWRSVSLRNAFLLVLCSFVATTKAAPLTEEELEIIEISLPYLDKYGYLNIPPSKDPRETIASDEFQRAVSNFQRYANVDVTGQVDNDTIEMMKRPRCGNKDPELPPLEGDPSSTSLSSTSRVRRYSVAGGNYRWNKNTLTYRIHNLPTMRTEESISEYQVRYDVRKAFKLWSDVTPLVFIEVFEDNVDVDIELRFGSRVHTAVYGDPAFDGEGGTLAHAFTPNSGWGKTNGDVHFDDDETFTHKKYTGVNFFYTAAHEIGHALGLDHSDQRSALMWPWDKGYIPNFRLPQDDRLGIQVIYGKNKKKNRVENNNSTTPSTNERQGAQDQQERLNLTTPSETTKIMTTPSNSSDPAGKNPFAVATDPPPTTIPTTTTPPLNIPPYCSTSLDAAANIRGTLMIFKGDRMWRFRPRYDSDGNPDGTFPLVAVDLDTGVETAQFFTGIKKGMKAVYERHDGKIVFLKARKKWIFDGTRLVEGPVLSSSDSSGYPQNVYGAYYDKATGLTYLFKGKKAWTYDEFSKKTTKSSLKKLFRGLHPSAKVNGAFSFYDHTFLLDGPDYYEADENNYVANVGKRNFGVDILGCPPMTPPQVQ